ncbi:MAG: M2 family metallopeptidase [Myxococcales bacterium]|jgi:peptidyl-dipeptidase A|nr:M2 family metallopeptidase [Myxococcales bacterium]
MPHVLLPALFTALTLAAAPAPKPTVDPAEARAFVAKTNADLKLRQAQAEQAAWVSYTYITSDTEEMAARAQEALMAAFSTAIADSMRFSALPADADPETTRALQLLRVNQPLPAPLDPAKRAELATLAAKLTSIYGKGRWCGIDGKASCRELPELERVLASEKRWDRLLDAWAGWHTISAPMKGDYARLVELANEGARDIGFADAGDLWRAGYDMTPQAFEQETERLWQAVKPLYDDLHCYVRGRLARVYPNKLPKDGTIPAHLLGNMWAQEWTNIYELVEPFPGRTNLDVSAALRAQKFDAHRMTKLAESFFVSLGLDRLPATFWERSMFEKPRDRAVVCHASAWNVDYSGDLRIKMCIEPTEEMFVTLHHELGHIYYFHAYNRLPVLFQSGANDGFHEAIGDAIALSITPSHLKKIGLLREAPSDRAALINVQMKSALEKVAFLPFGKLIDKWRWDVFAGKVKPEAYNAAWWALRRQYQGVTAPVTRTEADFDPGAKYHIPGSVPYMRYFLARILQFQFHKALCDAAGFKGPLHECSIHGSQAAGKKLQAMMALGASRPWPEALEALTGSREIDPGALLEYFSPLREWLAEQNKGQRCGW